MARREAVTVPRAGRARGADRTVPRPRGGAQHGRGAGERPRSTAKEKHPPIACTRKQQHRVINSHTASTHLSSLILSNPIPPYTPPSLSQRATSEARARSLLDQVAVLVEMDYLDLTDRGTDKTADTDTGLDTNLDADMDVDLEPDTRERWGEDEEVGEGVSADSLEVDLVRTRLRTRFQAACFLS